MSSQVGVLLFLFFVILRSNDVESYSKVLTMGAGSNQDGPKVYKALNMDLIFPKTFNSSENVISTTQTSVPYTLIDAVESISSTTDGQFTPGYSPSQTVEAAQPSLETPAAPTNHYHPSFHIENNQSDFSEEEGEATLPPPATGRAVDYRPAYPFSQLLTPNTKGYRPSAERSRPLSKSSAGQQHVVYPSYHAPRTPSRAEIDKLSGKGKFSDRFTPAEGVASNTFKLRQNQNRNPSISRPIGQTSNKVASFVQGQDLYAFPPNINSRYPAPKDIKQASPSDTITSYLPPAAGPLDNSKFVGPVNPDLLPESMKKSALNGENGNGYQYNPPEASLDDGVSETDGGNVPAPPAAMDNSDSMADGGSMDMAPADPVADDGMMDESPPLDHDHHVHDDHHDHHDIGGYVDGKEYPTPPPGYLEEHDHDHHHHPHPDIEFSHGPYFHDHHTHDYPDIVFDDYHDHHIHHDHHPLPMTTEPPPPPPEPEQPRVKKYSYFYIGRKLWYIPLYFTVWFTFYVLWLILKSIARHKVNLPNHYVTRRNVEDLGHRKARETIDKLTVKVMDGIENFKLRYMG